MKLKYYLRGLGLGILVTALILSIAGRNRRTMTDAQIKERAKELGMIENTMLVEKTEESFDKEPEQEAFVSEKTEQEEKETEAVDTDRENSAVTENETEDNDSENAAGEKETKKEANTVSDDPEAPAADTEKLKSDSEEPTADTEKSKADLEDPTADTEKPKADSESSETEGSLSLTIVSGDSSYTVAQKLVELGVADSVAETDRFLCANGYDRTIRTGTYTIAPGESLEAIAKRINGK